MGTGASAPKEGVLANPRLIYASQRSNKEKKNFVIDAPVLIDLKHGSIRYREYKDEMEVKNKSKMKEKPFEGEERQKKGHYFYHPRLQDFSEKASVDKEDPHKFLMVVKGPASAKQKKIFYVYGKGWNATDGEVTKPARSKAMGQDPTWPQRQNPNDVYYNISFLNDVPKEDPIPGIPNRHSMEFAVGESETVNDLRVKVAHTIIKSAMYIHMCFLNQEVSGDTLVEQLQSNGSVTNIGGVKVTLMDH